MEIRIGTSGWYYKHWKGPFYPLKIRDSEILPFYLKHFDTVEINNTFYRLPEKNTVKAWCQHTPDGFLFAVKGSRFITHMKKLSDPAESVKYFFDAVKPLGRKLGPIVFQLPPRWKCNIKRLEVFLNELPKELRYSFEFRDKSWLCSEIYRLLAKHNAALCIYDLKGFESPREITADFTYIRLHGPSKNAYQGCYDKNSLHKWAGRIKTWKGRLAAVYIYFDNDQMGYAAHNAMRLKEKLEQSNII
ncbi:MAG: DUF72 domain-containing protein [Deltaproteobacteria bacterium]|jgi:uncharacterized protein YecE (DUF72 family)|nr:DUF72 domain-containing protein [Deltaproteobacteria bacterium]